MTSLINYLKDAYSLDTRALALMRIGLGLVLLLDVGIRISDLEAHYADSGVFPLWVLFQFKWNFYHLSVHTMSGLWQVQLILFLLGMVAALCMTAGYKTRIATIVCWFFLVSVQNRNPMILQGGDDLLRLLLFWGIFLPWGKRYALDNVYDVNTHSSRSVSFFGTAGFAYMIQVGSVYFFSALMKDSPEWHTEGTAIYYALSLDQILLPAGRLIYPYPEMLKWMTLSVYYLEMLVPFLLVMPVFNTFFRTIAILALLGLHIGIALTLYVGLFYLISIVALIGLIPKPIIDRFTAPVINGSQEEPVSYRDFVREGALVMLIAYCLLWNFGEVPKSRYTVMPKLQWIGYLLRLDQHWGMFAPGVFKDDGWFILEGTKEDGKIIDLNRDGYPVSYEKPESVVSLFDNDRWRKYGENYLFISNEFMRPFYCNYMMRIWNEKNGNDKIKRLDVIYMKEVTAPDYQPVVPTREVLCSCGE